MSDEPQEPNYTFKQTKNAITVELPSPDGLVQEDIDVSVVGKKLCVVVRKPGEDEEKLLEDTLFDAVNANSLDWKLDSNKWKISLTLRKVEPKDWTSLFVVIINIPPIFQNADDNKVNEVIKIFREAKRKEDGEDDGGDDSGAKQYSTQELISMKHPIKGYTIVGWATTNRKYPVVEFLLRAFGPKKVANLANEQDFEIIKEWQKEKKRLELLEKKKHEPKEASEEEEEAEEEKDFASSLAEKFEKYTVEMINQIGEFGVYEGETQDFEIPVELPPVEEEKEEPKEKPKEEKPANDEDEDNEEKPETDEDREDNEDEPKQASEEKKPKKVKVVEPPKPIIVKYRHGFGSAYYANDDVYIGNFENTIREGMGAYIYRGDYLSSMREKKEKEQEEKGEEEENTDGDEDALNPDNVPLCYYVGDWKDNKKNGKGRMLFHNGDRFYGDYVDDKKHCERGIYLYNNGDMYVGEFKEDHKSGKGVYTFAADGSSLEGDWKEGRFITGVWNWKCGKIAFSSNNFTDSKINGNFAFANFKSFGSFDGGQWKLSNITL